MWQVSPYRRRSLLGQLVIVLVGAELLFFSGFLNFSLPVGSGGNLSAAARNVLRQLAGQLPPPVRAELCCCLPAARQPDEPVAFTTYLGQAPVAVFVGYILGPILGALAAILYLLTGIFGAAVNVHPFVAGGGVSYYSQPSCGYLIGLAAGAFAAGKLTDGKRTSLSQCLAVLSGVGLIHLFGLVWLFGYVIVSGMAEGLEHQPVWAQWVFEEARNLSWYPLPWDLTFAVMLVGLGFPFRWLVDLLTARDIGPKPRRQARLEEIKP